MSLLLLFTPSYFDNLHDFGERVTDRYKKKFKRKEIIDTPKEDEEAIKEGSRDASRTQATEPSTAAERVKYISFLKEEIKGLNERIKMVAELRDVIQAEKFRRKMNQLESARAILDSQYYETLQKQFEDDFLTLLFLSLE